MNKRNPRAPRQDSIRLATAAFVLVAFLSMSASCHAQNLNVLFQDVIDDAQGRMVKVYGAGAGRVNSYATGIIVSDDGKIVTMQGVFLDGEQVRVALPSGETVEASILRRNRTLQLALLQIPKATPKYFELSDKPVGEKGDWVVALSNAFMVAEKEEPMSANLGVISLRTTIEARLSPRDVAYQGKLVLIDAITSNPGAGGGAVVNADAQLVGMIGKVINSTKTNTRLNYAVPASVLKEFVAGTLVATSDRKTSTEKADLGIRLFALGGRRAPAYIDKIISRSPAAVAGLRPDDLVISLAGKKIGTIRDYQKVLDELQPDQEVVIVVKRRDELLRLGVKTIKKK